MSERPYDYERDEEPVVLGEEETISVGDALTVVSHQLELLAQCVLTALGARFHGVIEYEEAVAVIAEANELWAGVCEHGGGDVRLSSGAVLSVAAVRPPRGGRPAAGGLATVEDLLAAVLGADPGEAPEPPVLDV